MKPTGEDGPRNMHDPINHEQAPFTKGVLYH